MAETITMPKLGFDMAEGVLVRWVKQEGNTIKKGDVLAEIETDKATVEVESSFSGIVAKHLVEAGTSVPVGAPIAVIAAEGETVTDIPSTSESKAEKHVDSEKTIEKQVLPAETKAVITSAGVFSSPLARRIAAENKIDLANVQGTGPGGRIVRKDIETILSRPPKSTVQTGISAQPSKVVTQKTDERVVVSKLRSAISKRMTESKQQIPHFYVTHVIHADRMMDLRKQYNDQVADEEKLSVNDFIIKAAALALRKFPGINASLNSEGITRHGSIHIGMAVSVEGGLLTVVIKNADQKEVRMISVESREMAARARAGKVKPDDVDGSTFSISNLGMYDVDNFAAIINPPEAAILAVGSVHDEAVVENGQLKVGKVLKVSISADHRVTDGAEAAQFMQELARLIENPLLLFL